MKIDLNWFKEQLDDIEMNTPRLSSHDSIWMLNRVHELIDQQAKPEILSNVKFNKGEKYRPIVRILKVKKEQPTVIMVNGEEFVWRPKSQYRG